MIDWHDLRYLLAVGRGLSLAEAAQRLHVDPSTVSRRLNALEVALGVQVFERADGRIELTTVGETLFNHAVAVELGVEALSQSATAAAAGLEPVPIVRLSAVPVIANQLLAPAVPALYARALLKLELIADGGNARFDRRDVDVALRFGRPSRGRALVRRIATIDYAAYRGRDAPDDIGWIVFDKDLEHLPHAEAIASFGAEDGVAMIARDAETMLAAARAGVGRASLPCFAAGPDDLLIRLEDRELSRDLWLIVHEDTRNTKAVAAVVRWLDDIFASFRRE